jgi:hypothetical protein
LPFPKSPPILPNTPRFFFSFELPIVLGVPLTFSSRRLVDDAGEDSTEEEGVNVVVEPEGVTRLEDVAAGGGAVVAAEVWDEERGVWDWEWTEFRLCAPDVRGAARGEDGSLACVEEELLPLSGTTLFDANVLPALGPTCSAERPSSSLKFSGCFCEKLWADSGMASPEPGMGPDRTFGFSSLVRSLASISAAGSLADGVEEGGGEET